MTTHTLSRSVMAGLGAVALAMGLGGCAQKAPTPPGFDSGISLSQAERTAADEGRVVVAVATADWCGPCQAYKRGTLADPTVTAWLDDHAVPVLIDVTDGMTEDAKRLNVSPIPATFVLRDGKVVASTVGNASADELMKVLESAAGK